MMMRKKIVACAVASIFCASLASMAADNKTPTPAKPASAALLLPQNALPAKPLNLPKLTAEQIVDRNVVARGGLAAWQRVQSMTMAGKLDAGKVRKDGGKIVTADSKFARAQARAEVRKTLFDNKEGGAEDDKVIQLPFQFDMKRPLKTRLEVPFQGQTAVQVYDGAQGWKLRPFLGRHEVEPYTAQEMKVAADQQPLDGPLINHAAKGTKVAVDGAEQVDDHDAYRLKLTLKNGDVRHLWVDAKTFLDLKFEGPPRRFDGKMRPVMTVFRDYKSVDGLMIPHLFETSVDGIRGSEKIVVDKVAVNPQLDDTRFAKPL